MKKKIIIHYPFIPSYRTPVFNELAKDSNFDVTIFSASSSNDKTLYSQDNGWEFDVKNTKLYSFSIFNKVLDFETGVISKLFKNRQEFDYYVILSNPNIITSWIYSIVAKLLGYKVIFWGHGLLRKEFGLKRIFRKLYYWIADQHWVYGEKAVPLLEELGLDSKIVHPIFNSLDYECQKRYYDNNIDKKKAFRKELSYSDDDLVAICMGRLLDKLQIDKVIRNVAHSKARGVSLKLIIIGDGPLMGDLSKIASECNVSESVLFTGSCYDEAQLYKYYISADLSIIMGVVGLAAMHSLAYGVPVLTNDNLESHCPEVEALIPGETAEFFIFNDSESFLDGIEKINLNKGSYSEKCIQVIESKYTPSQQVSFIRRAFGVK